MYNITFHYLDGEIYQCNDVIEIAYDIGGGMGLKTLLEDEIMKHNFKSYDALSLRSDSSNYFVSCDNLRCFEIKKI